MTVRHEIYDLNCRPGEYEALRKAFEGVASISSENEKYNSASYIVNPENFDVSLNDQRKETEAGLAGLVIMHVTRSTFRKPKLIKQIVKRLEGKLVQSYKGHTGPREGVIDFYLDDSPEKFASREK